MDLGDLWNSTDFKAIWAYILIAVAVVGAFWRTFVKIRTFWIKKLSPIWSSVEKGLIVLNGRDAITLPEDPSVVVAGPVDGILDRQARAEEAIRIDRMARDIYERATDEKLEFVIGLVHKIEHEVTPNGGGSIKDAVGRIEWKIDSTETAVGTNTDHLRQIDSRLQDGDERFGRVEQSIKGGFERLEIVEASLSTQAEANKAMWPAMEAIAKAKPPEEPSVNPRNERASEQLPRVRGAVEQTEGVDGDLGGVREDDTPPSQ